MGGSEGGSSISRTKGLPSPTRSVVDPYARISVRSPGSSETSRDRAQVLKDACRAVIQFMFTQVGVGGLVVGYTIVGAITFQAIEGVEEPEDLIGQVHTKREDAVQRLWDITNNFNTFNQERWNDSIQTVISEYQDDLTGYIQAGYDEKTVEERWTFPAALMFTLSVITMIGYGNTVPRTEWGKIATMVYALFGIPVYILYFMNMGKVFANMFKWVYRSVHGCMARRKAAAKYGTIGEEGLEMLGEEVPVPSTAAIWVMLGYLSIGTVMFAEWEDWNYLDSVYFVVTSLLKIGLGDYVPGSGERDGESHHAKLYINYSYLLLGMGVVAMNYNLLKEEVLVKAAQMRKKMKDACSRTK